MKGKIFNTDEVKAILDGRKSQFREVIDFCKVDDIYINENGKNVISINDKILNTITEEYIKSFINKNSKYKVGDILYVKETFCFDRDGFPVFKAGFIFSPYFDGIPPRWKPSTHLKKEDARIFLKITSVRVERLKDIGFLEVQKEGFCTYWNYVDKEPIEYDTTRKEKRENGWYNHHLDDFIKSWNSQLNFTKGIRKSQNNLNKYSWEDNPYVFVYEFKVIQTNG